MLASVLIAILNSTVGVWVSVKRMHYFSSAVSHGLFLPVAIGILIGRVFFPMHNIDHALANIISYICICITIILFIYMKKNDLENQDNFFSFFWAIGMSLGIIIMMYTPGYPSNLQTYLFGDLFLISKNELLVLLILSFLGIMYSIINYQTLKIYYFQEDYANILGLDVRKQELFMMLFCGFAIVALLKAVGVILLITIISFPAATAMLTAKHFSSLMLKTALITGFCLMGSIYLAGKIDLPTSPTGAMTATGIYIITMIIKKMRSKGREY